PASGDETRTHRRYDPWPSRSGGTQRGGTHGSPANPSFFAAHKPLVPRLPAGQAGLRRRNAHAPAIRSLAKPKWRNSARRNPWFPREPLLLRSAQTTRPAPPGRPSRPPATKRARTGDTILGQAEVAELSAEEPMVPPRTPPSSQRTNHSSRASRPAKPASGDETRTHRRYDPWPSRSGGTQRGGTHGS